MGIQTSFHAALGGEFLGMRLSRRGEVEVVYDNGLTNRQVWKVLAGGRDGPSVLDMSLADEERLCDALRIASNAPRVLPTLYDEMKKRAIYLENQLR